MITAEELRKLLSYDPETGVFTWRVDRFCGRGRVRMASGDVAGATGTGGYRVITVFYNGYAAHRLAWLYMTGEWPSHHLDHINGTRDDNRWCNLRAATRAENNRNVKIKNTNAIGAKGVTNHKGRYRARITVDGKGVHLGYFGCPTAAHLAYCKAAKEYFGEFARVG